MTNIIDSNGQMYKTPGFWATAGAVVAGSAVQGTINQSTKTLGRSIINTISAIGQSCDKVVIRKAVNDAFKNSKLKDNGVELLDIKPSNIQSYSLPDIFGKNKVLSSVQTDAANKKLYDGILNSFPKFLKKTNYARLVSDVLVNIILAGKHAAYFPKAKLIGVNIDKLGASAFHEMGHAINHNQNLFWKIMQHSRMPAQISGAAIGLTALLKRKKMEGEKPVGTFDKVTTFIKDNVGKLVLATSVPIFSEELMATYRGNKMAKKLLSPEMFSKVKNLNKFGAISYISAALIGTGAAYAASKTRDKIAKPKPVKS